MRPVFLLFALVLSVGAAQAQSLEEIDKRQAALIEAWEKTPLTIRRALFIKGEPRGFGLYQERESKEFKRVRRSWFMPSRLVTAGKTPAKACSSWALPSIF
jgi:hypothetical protein